MTTGEENLAKAVGSYFEDRFLAALTTHKCALWESPIEGLFYLAISTACEIGMTPIVLTLEEPQGSYYLDITPQAKVCGCIVDYLFLMTNQHGRISQLIVECDGHDFHERTKQQAAKDRSKDRTFQEAGYTVYRFTGSEIYRDALACARQVLRWAENAAWVG